MKECCQSMLFAEYKTIRMSYRMMMMMMMMKAPCCRFDRFNFFTSSSASVPVCLPSPKEIHLWYILPNEVNDESLLNQYLDVISPYEKEDVFRMRGDDLRKRALLARTLVRTTIARYQINSEVSPRSLKFKKNIHGKPEVEWKHSDHWHPPPLEFNISHTSSLIACGVTLGSPIGIDVEEKQRTIKHNILSFARRYFSDHEVEFLTAITDFKVQQQEFIKLWTLKEAYVKALGKGFSGAPFKTFTIQFKAGLGGIRPSGISNFEASEIVVEPLDDLSNVTNKCQFSLLELAGSHYAAVCTQKDSTTCTQVLAGEANGPMKLIVRKTIPLVEDVCVSGTDAAISIGG